MTLQGLSSLRLLFLTTPLIMHFLHEKSEIIKWKQAEDWVCTLHKRKAQGFQLESVITIGDATLIRLLAVHCKLFQF